MINGLVYPPKYLAKYRGEDTFKDALITPL
jgi:hypothetical protein